MVKSFFLLFVLSANRNENSTCCFKAEDSIHSFSYLHFSCIYSEHPEKKLWKVSELAKSFMNRKV
jgi:hypothetical protein